MAAERRTPRQTAGDPQLHRGLHPRAQPDAQRAGHPGGVRHQLHLRRGLQPEKAGDDGIRQAYQGYLAGHPTYQARSGVSWPSRLNPTPEFNEQTRTLDRVRYNTPTTCRLREYLAQVRTMRTAWAMYIFNVGVRLTALVVTVIAVVFIATFGGICGAWLVDITYPGTPHSSWHPSQQPESLPSWRLPLTQAEGTWRR